jgi:hypothetical protein
MAVGLVASKCPAARSSQLSQCWHSYYRSFQSTPPSFSPARKPRAA